MARTRVVPVTTRHIAVSLHSARPAAISAAADFVRAVVGRGIEIWLRDEARDAVASLLPGVRLQALGDEPHTDIELVVVFGGDGTILRAAEWAMPHGLPVLGVNLGHVGFLAELEPSQLNRLVSCVLEKSYAVEERLCLEVMLRDKPGGDVVWSSFAINEVSLEKAARERMVEILVSIDGHPLSRWGSDGVLVATPTGSTAYAFSAQGPVVWPEVEAILVVPLLAHALFARPLVLNPNSWVGVSMIEDQATSGVLWCDGRRSVNVAPGQFVEVRRNARSLRLARTSEQPFVDRLVRKFDLPVAGWRGAAELERRRQRPAPVAD